MRTVGVKVQTNWEMGGGDRRGEERSGEERSGAGECERLDPFLLH